MRTNKKEKVILEVAEREFLLKGFAGARTVEIASQAGVSQSMLNYYFKSKEMLFERVMEEKTKQLQESVAVVLEMEGMTAVEKIVEMIVRHFNFLCQNPDLPRFVINEVIARPEYIEKIKNDNLPMLEDLVGRLQRDLDEAARQGEVRQVDAATLLMDILSVNIFSFIIIPILATANPSMDFQAFYNARCQENVQLILNRINPDI